MHLAFERLARAMALAGGLVLSILIVMVCLSIAGRTLSGIVPGVGPIDGDFELVEAGMAFAIFAFLPLCQLHGAHASVDVFTSRLPPRASRILRAITEAAFAAVLVLIAVQLLDGLLSKRRSGQTTLLLQFPVWWGYAAAMTGAAAAALVGIYVAAMRVLEAARGRDILPADAEAEH